MRGMSLQHLGARLRWQSARAWGALGTAELVALALLALWWGLQAQVVGPLAGWLEAERGQLARSQQQVARAARVAAPRGAVGSLAEFLGFMPAPTRREDQLLQLHALAQAQGLQWQGAHYATEVIGGLPTTRLRMSLRLQGPYAAQRRFLHEALVRMPNLAVDRLALDEEGGVMTAQLEASLLYRNEAPR